MNPLRPLAAVLAACVLAAAAQAQPAPSAAASAPARAASAPGAAASAPAAPGQPPAFATVIREAKRSDGLIPFWRKDDKVWLELAPSWFESSAKPLRLSANVSQSIGQRGLHGAAMGPDWMVAFARPNANQVQLLALNAAHVAEGAARQRGLAESFSRSLLASAPAASAPHPESKAVLVDASFLLADLAGYSRALELSFRMPYAFDRANSSFGRVYADAEATTLVASLHYAVPRLPVPPATPLPPGAPQPTPPSTLPDARSLFVGVVYGFATLPDKPMAPRRADGRLGHFYTAVTDFGSSTAVQQRQRWIDRWRLEKKDPAAALSDPVKPITYWLDRNIPPEFRDTVREGILEWNKAFEKIGIRNAVVVQQQPDDAEWETLDPTHASVRWYYTTDAGASASGPSHSDPRSGEILDADIAVGDGWTRILRREVVEQVPTATAAHGEAAAHARLSRLSQRWSAGAQADAHCDYAEQALGELSFALDSLAVTGQVAPDSPEAEAFVKGFLKHVVMHEVGHTLGLKHNFKASTVYTVEQLRDPAFTAAKGVATSVMDYLAINLPLPGERRAELYDRSIGVYDEWAIEYAYRPLDAKEEAQALERIAARSTEPQLAFADDIDAGIAGGEADGFDPEANRFDLGGDPLAYVERRFALTRELWRRAQDWKTRPEEGALRQRSMFGNGFVQMRLAAGVAAKHVGGLVAVREVPGTPAAAPRSATYVPVDAQRQRRALELLARGLFSADSFRFQPRFLANLSPDFVEWGPRQPVSLANQVGGLQTGVLDRLMSASTAMRVLDAPLMSTAPTGRGPLTLAELYGSLQDAIWSELKSGGDIDGLRRNLQREHLRRLQAVLVRGGAGLPADAQSLVRSQARRLQADLRAALGRPGRSADARAHLDDSLNTLGEALAATMTRMQ